MELQVEKSRFPCETGRSWLSDLDSAEAISLPFLSGRKAPRWTRAFTSPRSVA